MKGRILLPVALYLTAAGMAAAQSPLPNPTLTPGAIDPNVTQANIDTTIYVRGWTRTVRPPEDYTERLKHQQIREYGYSDTRLGDYEEDHLIPLEIGGSPDNPRNLWPEPHKAPGGWGHGGRIISRICCAGWSAPAACRSPKRSGRSRRIGLQLIACIVLSASASDYGPDAAGSSIRSSRRSMRVTRRSRLSRR